MAKRGYRGKHPHNDMKVSKNPSSDKYSSKLTKEYNNLPDKQKYSYIRSNYFYPQASATLTASDQAANGQKFTIISTAGTSYEFTAHTNTTVTSTGQFSRATGEVEMMTALHSCFTAADSITAGVFTATLDTTVGAAAVTITQVEPGPDGNTTVTEGLTNVTKTDFTGG